MHSKRISYMYLVSHERAKWNTINCSYFFNMLNVCFQDCYSLAKANKTVLISGSDGLLKFILHLFEYDYKEN